MIIHIDKLKKTINQKVILNIQSVSFNPNTIYAIAGENGSGKTSFLKALTGHIVPTEYSFSFDEKEVTNIVNNRQNIGFEFNNNFIMKESPLSSSSLFSIIHENWDPKLFISYLEYFRIPLDSKVQVLSSGQKRMYKIAIALSHKAKCILLDEPTSDLDIVSKNKVINALKQYNDRMNEEAIIIFTSHDFQVIESCADHVFFMKKGHFFFDSDLPFLSDEETDDDYIIYQSKYERYLERDTDKIGFCWKRNDFQPELMEILCKRKDTHNINPKYIKKPSLSQLFLLMNQGEENKEKNEQTISTISNT